MDLGKANSQLKPPSFRYSSDEEDSDEAGDEDFHNPYGFEQVPTKIKQEPGTYTSSLNTPEATSSTPYSHCQYTSSVHSLNNNIIDSNKQQGNQLVQDLEDITEFKSTSDFDTVIFADSTQSLQSLTDSIVVVADLEGFLWFLQKPPFETRRNPSG